jgi:hypothetical protein
MQIQEIILILVLLIKSGFTVNYIIQTIKGKIIPQRTAWLIWTILAGVYFFSGLQLGSGFALLFLLQELFSTGSVYLTSLKFGKGGYTKIDIICLSLAILGIVLWQLTANPLVGLFFACFTDSIGAYLISKEAIIRPEQENLGIFAFTIISVVITLIISFSSSSLTSLISTIYIGIVNLIIVICIIYGYIISRKKTNYNLD